MNQGFAISRVALNFCMLRPFIVGELVGTNPKWFQVWGTSIFIEKDQLFSTVFLDGQSNCLTRRFGFWLLR
jgi:hypothetical protein